MSLSRFISPHGRIKNAVVGLCHHEAGHAIVATSLGVPIKEIEMEFWGAGGHVGYDRKHKRLSPDKKAIIGLAGLAGERFHHKDPGIVFHYKRTASHPYVFTRFVPPEYKGLVNDEGTGDLQHVEQLIPKTILEAPYKWCWRCARHVVQIQPKDEWVNKHMRVAWDILHANERPYLKLVKALCQGKHNFSVEYPPGFFNHILRKVQSWDV